MSHILTKIEVNLGQNNADMSGSVQTTSSAASISKKKSKNAAYRERKKRKKADNQDKPPPARENKDRMVPVREKKQNNVNMQAIGARINRLKCFVKWLENVLLREALNILRSRYGVLGTTSLRVLSISRGINTYFDFCMDEYDHFAKFFDIRVTFVHPSNEWLALAVRHFSQVQRTWKAEFYAVDYAQHEFTQISSLSNDRFHLVVCHSAGSVQCGFENFSRASILMQNFCEHLAPGGILSMTAMNGFEIVRRLQDVADAAKKMKHKGEEPCGVDLSNPMFGLDPLFDLNKIPLFGATYNFRLSFDDVDSPPLHLVHPRLLHDLAAKYYMLPDMMLSKPFPDLFERLTKATHPDYRSLIAKMKAIRQCTKVEFRGVPALSKNARKKAAAKGKPVEGKPAFAPGSTRHDGFDSAKRFLKQFKHANSAFDDESADSTSVGTLTKDEWEILSLFSAFVYTKHTACPENR